MPYHSPRQNELYIIEEEPKKKKITLKQMFPSMKLFNKNKKTNTCSCSKTKEIKNKKK